MNTYCCILFREPGYGRVLLEKINWYAQGGQTLPSSLVVRMSFKGSPCTGLYTLNCLDCSSWTLLAYLISLDFFLHLVAYSKVLKFSSCTEQIYVGYQTNLSNRCWQRLIKHQPTTCQWNRTKCATNNFTRTSWLLNVSISVFSKVS